MRPPKLLQTKMAISLATEVEQAAVDSVIGTAIKTRIHRHLKHPDQRLLKSPKILQTITFSPGVVDTTCRNTVQQCQRHCK
jgi:hypothetical protein